MSAAPTRAEGLTRLHNFVPHAGRAYAAGRNHDHGPGRHTAVSGLSPWIRHRLVRETDVLQATLDRHSASAADKFVSEVFWRIYFKGWLEHRPGVWDRYLSGVTSGRRRLDADAALADRFYEAVEGRTGIACFDHWARELLETGYMHNHARMWFASIWIFTLQLPWELGAAWFLEHLLDGDPAANTCSWRWVAGLHTKGKTYLARPDNIEKYTNGRFRPTGLAREAPPLQAPDLGSRLPLVGGDPLPTGSRFALLLHQDDLHGESLGLTEAPTAVAALAPGSDQAELPRKFTAGALQDGLSRAADTWDIAAGPVFGSDALNEAVEWARATGAEQVVTPFATVGPSRDALDTLERRLTEEGVALVRVQRDIDRLAWPFAKAGFFGLKKKIPRLLGDLGFG